MFLEEKDPNDFNGPEQIVYDAVHAAEPEIGWMPNSYDAKELAGMIEGCADTE